MVVDDYGHHPTEIAAVIAAHARPSIAGWWSCSSRIATPARAHLMHEFGTALSGADEVVLTDIYAAGEAPIPGVTVEALGAGGTRRGPRPGARRPGARRPAGGGGRTWRGTAI